MTVLSGQILLRNTTRMFMWFYKCSMMPIFISILKRHIFFASKLTFWDITSAHMALKQIQKRPTVSLHGHRCPGIFGPSTLLGNVPPILSGTHGYPYWTHNEGFRKGFSSLDWSVSGSIWQHQVHCHQLGMPHYNWLVETTWLQDLWVVGHCFAWHYESCFFFFFQYIHLHLKYLYGCVGCCSSLWALLCHQVRICEVLQVLTIHTVAEFKISNRGIKSLCEIQK